MSAGLTPPAPTAVEIKVGSDDVTSLFDVTVSGQTMTIKLKNGIDLKTAKHGSSDFAADDEIVVSYNAKLNDSAVIGGTGNDNTVNLEFSNNPNSGGDGDKGKTPDDKVVVFTYKIIANKVDENNQPLKGAGFTLYKEDGTVFKEFAAGDATSFEFKGVDAGKYVLKETTVPAGYNKVADINIEITAQYDESKEPPTLSSLTATPSDFTVDLTAGSVTGTIKNEKGSELPSTGGIGTVIFYVLGSLLVIGCGIVLVSKRRTNN
jgi:fimbrial isopeptide formation D2 family protein/LPXTG-motif cell wall-anchored protein